ncbi:DinB family protein [uncultured Chitinophaga sp.]|uniref:DinB family protein n=1 Tax=uncultured Chitinophaga sp. TaxID=339340 RepID=UPI0025DE2C91|nr:DinB family protein [uncultured Chitinophaga sp.]
MQHDFAQQATKALSEMETLLSLFSRSQINKVPFEGSWTAAQVAEHIRLSVSGCVELIEGDTTETERDPAALEEDLRKMFLNFDIKMQSPDFVVPAEREYNKDELIGELEQLRQLAEEAIMGNDLTLTCTGFEFPQLGYMTGEEVVTFIIAHTQRHNHQLKNIYNALS